MNKYKQLFWSNNYVLIKDVFNQYESKFIAKSATKILNKDDTNYTKYYEKKGNLYKVENFINTNHGLRYFVKHRVEPVAKKIYDGDITLFEDKLCCKYPGKDGFGFYQDQPKWKEYNNKFFFTIALFPDRVNIGNGCLQFADTKYLDRSYDHDFICQETNKNLKWNCVEANPCDLLIFNSFIPRRTFENNTKKPRKIFYLTYNDSDSGDFYYSFLRQKEIKIEQNKLESHIMI